MPLHRVYHSLSTSPHAPSHVDHTLLMAVETIPGPLFLGIKTKKHQQIMQVLLLNRAHQATTNSQSRSETQLSQTTLGMVSMQKMVASSLWTITS